MRKLFWLLLFVMSSIVLGAQAPTATLSGRVADQTGAVIPGATVTVTGLDGKPATVTSDGSGAYQVPALAPGSYTVSADATGFAHYTQTGVTIAPGHPFTLNLTLQVQVQEEKVNVQSEHQTQLDVGATSNANSMVIKGKDLEALSDDPDELQSELQALAGPSAGPNGGQIYIDGFSGGQLPPKSAIREIRVNQNPFSAQYDKLGYGRIEVLTKPGSDKLHGQFFFNDSNAVLNSQNPFVHTAKPSYNTDIFDGNIGGPLGKKASIFLDASRRNIDEFAAISAIDPTTFSPFTQEVPNPRRRTSISPRFDYQLTQSNTLTARYQFTRDSDENSGVGGFALPSQGYNDSQTEHQLQISDTQILSPKVVNETRFQWEHELSNQTPFSTATAVQVQGAFTMGGNSQGKANSTTDNYEFQNYTSVTHGSHLIKVGARFRGLRISNLTNPNFNGTFIFSNTIDKNGMPVTALQAYQNAIASPNACNSTSYDPGSCSTQYSITTGTPQINANWFDAGLYVEDEWRVRPNLSVNYGLRFESQNNIHDLADFAPRLGFAWGIGGDGKAPPKTVVRGGFGMFYDRFGQNLVQTAERLNGTTQISSVYATPNFYPGPPQGQNIVAPTIYKISPDLRAPYTIQSAMGLERQLTKAATVTVTYLNSIGNHAFFIRNINAPLVAGQPGVLSGQYGNDNVYQYDSEGVFRQNQLIANGRLSLGKTVSLFGFYTLSFANSNVPGGGGGGGFFGGGTNSSASFLSNQFDPGADYGRAGFDVRDRAFIGGSITVPHGFQLSPFIIINSGSPYSITTGQDNNRDSILSNDRPALVSPTSCATVTPQGSNVCTPLGTFNAGLGVTQPVQVNSETGPGNATVNLRLSKTFGFGRETSKGGGGGGGGGMGGPRGGPPGGGLAGRGLSGGGGGNPFGFGGGTNHRYNLTLAISARNLLNSQNPGVPVGSLSSPFFGQTISSAGGPFSSSSSNRRIDLQVRFAF